jgi:hypothetical protein
MHGSWVVRRRIMAGSGPMAAASAQSWVSKATALPSYLVIHLLAARDLGCGIPCKRPCFMLPCLAQPSHLGGHPICATLWQTGVL